MEVKKDTCALCKQPAVSAITKAVAGTSIQLWLKEPG
jgi:hypothetical protein